ncbi:biotin/lipoyl-binding protein, partial [Mesorhizobium sp. M4B.F.Ca.ET.150.01.1.1]|uniref:biotin/lipoyl-binding protein n=1 Tax=Mesorhizobium sp. M4B.F.Ca.ET.150.01.1.1 TaxID=2563948 RepID=UPI001AEECB9F
MVRLSTCPYTAFISVMVVDLTMNSAACVSIAKRPARARISGTVASVHVSEGAQVGKGDMVATVVDDKL